MPSIVKTTASHKMRQKVRINIFQEIIKTFHNFCELTSLDGYAYLRISDSTTWKIIWTLVILSLTCLAVCFLGTIQILRSQEFAPFEPHPPFNQKIIIWPTPPTHPS